MNIKKINALLCAVVMVLSLAACGSNGDKASGSKHYTVGICQLVQHDALDAATKGFRDATTAASSAAHAGQPAMMSMTVTAPPVVNDPSTVRSATSSRRNVMYTPRAMMPQMMPWATPPGRRETRFGRLRDARTSEFIKLPHIVEYPCRRNCGREPGICSNDQPMAA